MNQWGSILLVLISRPLQVRPSLGYFYAPLGKIWKPLQHCMKYLPSQWMQPSLLYCSHSIFHDRELWVFATSSSFTQEATCRSSMLLDLSSLSGVFSVSSNQSKLAHSGEGRGSWSLSQGDTPVSNSLNSFPVSWS